MDDDAMEAETRKIMGRLNPNFSKFEVPVKTASGGQRQSMAIARAVYLNAKNSIMDKPTTALVGTERIEDVTNDEILSMIILGKKPERAA